MLGENRLRVLIVEDDPSLSEALREQLQDWGFDAGCAHTLHAATAQLQQEWTFVMLDLALPDGSGMQIAEALARRTTKPIIVAVSGTASVAEGFRLAQLGVQAYLPKPLRVPDLRETLRVLLEDSANNADMLEALASSSVGTSSYHEVTDRIRRAMVMQALRLAGGNKTGAARILKLSRQAVQQLVRSFELP